MNRKTSLLVILSAICGGGFSLADPGVPKDYPLTKCPISGEEFGHGGMTPFKVSHEGTDVWLCCKSCQKKFDKDPAKYAKAVKDASVKK